jgi:hypothetical protein
MDATGLLQDFFATPGVEIKLTTLIPNLALAALLAWLLGRVYIRYGTSLSNRRLFARNFVLIAATTTLIITVVKSSLALSLGLVGALSIVRFRSAIKEPEELAYLFITIAIGLGLGADQTRITLAAFALILGVIWVQGARRGAQADQNLYLTVTTDGRNPGGLDQIVDVLKANCAAVDLRRVEESPDLLEASFLVEFEDIEQLTKSKEELRRLNESMQISFVDHHGIL